MQNHLFNYSFDLRKETFYSHSKRIFFLFRKMSSFYGCLGTFILRRKRVLHIRTQISHKSKLLSKKGPYKHQTWCEGHWRCLEYNTSTDINVAKVISDGNVRTSTSPYFGSPISTYSHLKTCDIIHIS